VPTEPTYPTGAFSFPDEQDHRLRRVQKEVKRLETRQSQEQHELDGMVDLLHAADRADLEENVVLIKRILLDTINKRLSMLYRRQQDMEQTIITLQRENQELKDNMNDNVRAQVLRLNGMTNALYAWMKECQRQRKIISWDPMTKRFF